MNYKLIPENYTEDFEQSRKESKQTYTKMYNEDYVRGLIDQVKALSEHLHGAIIHATNRGTQRAAIPEIRKALKTIEEFKK